MYGRHLTADEADALTSPRKVALPSIRRWLSQHDVEDVSFSPATNRLKVRGSVRALEAAFRTEIHAYDSVERSDNARWVHQRILRASQPLTIPSNILDDVSYISLNSHPIGRSLTAQRHGEQNSDMSNIGKKSKRSTSSNGVIDTVRAGAGATPAFLREWYRIPKQTNANETNAQGIPEFYDEAWTDKDLSMFFNTFMDGEAMPTLVTHHVASRDDTKGRATGEASLDLQYITAIAPRTTTYVWSQPGSNPFSESDEPFVEWAEEVLTMKKPPFVVSLSYSDDEDHIFAASEAYARSFDPLLMKLGARGVSVFMASGDDGVAGQSPDLHKTDAHDKAAWCKEHGPQWPTSSPYLTSVGATMLSKSTGPSGFFDTLDEVVCSSQLGSPITSGGGFSNRYDRPKYQEAAVQSFLATKNLPPSDFFNASGRAYPDVTAFGNNYQVMLNGATGLVSGTSASSPVFAAMITLVNDLRLNAGKPPLGFLNPTLYLLQQRYPLAFNDITIGTNAAGMGSGKPVCDFAFHAESGWDAASGLGSPNFPVLSQLLLNVEDALKDGGVPMPSVVAQTDNTSDGPSRASMNSLLTVSIASLVASLVLVCGAIVYVKRHTRSIKSKYCELEGDKADTPKYPSHEKKDPAIFTIDHDDGDDEEVDVELTEVKLDR
ncbi:hypothetical protein, variant [Aphanomyces invadans]|nr:hypothetical protein, variant [Aphanomyces invadans]ETV94242.1 hypothetical protein, variant [Aphanomyces invadans]|eukprot:XP_008877003.1 hypothetical protein, variant [Aphanomyces invadans]